MMYDALKNLEEQSESGDATWMNGLKDAAATGFLGVSLVSSIASSLNSAFSCIGDSTSHICPHGLLPADTSNSQTLSF